MTITIIKTVAISSRVFGGLSRNHRHATWWVYVSDARSREPGPQDAGGNKAYTYMGSASDRRYLIKAVQMLESWNEVYAVSLVPQARISSWMVDSSQWSYKRVSAKVCFPSAIGMLHAQKLACSKGQPTLFRAMLKSIICCVSSIKPISIHIMAAAPALGVLVAMKRWVLLKDGT